MTEILKQGRGTRLHGQLDNDLVRLVKFLRRPAPSSASVPSIWMRGEPDRRSQRGIGAKLVPGAV